MTPRTPEHEDWCCAKGCAGPGFCEGCPGGEADCRCVVSTGYLGGKPPVTFAQIVIALGVTYKDPGITVWLNTPNHMQINATPLQMIAAGDIDRVAEAVARIGDCDPEAITGHCDRCFRPLPHTVAELRACPQPARPVLRDVPRLPATRELEPECGGGACYCGGCVL